MSFKATEQPMSGGINIEPMETGTYPARLVGVSIIGLHSVTYQGEVKEPKISIALTYEFLDEFMKDEDGNDLTDKPRWLTENMPFYNLNNQKAKSTERYMSIDPMVSHGGDWAEMLGMPIMVSVVQNAGKGKNAGKIFNNVDSVAPMRPKEAAKAPELVNQPFLFDFYSPTLDEWKRTPNLVKALVRKALDFPGSEMEEWGDVDNQEIKIEDAPKKTKKIVSKEEAQEEASW